MDYHLYILSSAVKSKAFATSGDVNTLLSPKPATEIYSKDNKYQSIQITHLPRNNTNANKAIKMKNARR